MQNSGPIGNSTRCSVQRATCSHPQSSMPTIRRLPPLPTRTSTDPVLGSRSDSVSASPPLIRKPARHRIAIRARVRSAYGPGPAWRITRMISSTVGDRPGNARPCSAARSQPNARVSRPVSVDGRLGPSVLARTCCPPIDRPGPRRRPRPGRSPEGFSVAPCGRRSQATWRSTRSSTGGLPSTHGAATAAPWPLLSDGKRGVLKLGSAALAGVLPWSEDPTSEVGSRRSAVDRSRPWRGVSLMHDALLRAQVAP